MRIWHGCKKIVNSRERLKSLHSLRFYIDCIFNDVITGLEIRSAVAAIIVYIWVPPPFSIRTGPFHLHCTFVSNGVMIPGGEIKG